MLLVKAKRTIGFRPAEALKKSLNGGVSGSVAMGFQVGSMMWLRTTLNYQYKNGGTFFSTMKKLYNQGGITRFY